MSGKEDTTVTSADISNPRDVEGILAVGLLIGWHALAGIAIVVVSVFFPQSANTVISMVVAGELTLVGSVTTHYFGNKRAEAEAQSAA